jgi:hypothetical protein
LCGSRCGWAAVIVAHGVAAVGAAANTGARETVPAATNRPTTITQQNLRKERRREPLAEIQFMIVSFRAFQNCLT